MIYYHCVTPNIPPFLGSNSEMAADDVVKTQEIASLGIHIGHAINKMKNFCNGIVRPLPGHLILSFV